MSEPIKSGDHAIIIEGALGTTGPNVGKRVRIGPDAIAPTKPQAKQRPRDLPKRDALTVGLFGSA